MYRSKINNNILTDSEYYDYVKKECEENGWDFDTVFDSPDSDFEYLGRVDYGDTGTTAFYSEIDDCYYSHSGDRLRNPDEYDRYLEGYTPFGDE